MRNESHWLHIANNLYSAIKYRCECPWGKPVDKHRHPGIILGEWPIGVCCDGIWGPLSKTLNGNHFVVAMTDRYSNSTRAIPTSNTTMSHIASLFMDNWIIQYDVPKHVLKNNRTAFVSKCLKWLCTFLGTKHLTTKACHPQTSRQVKRFNNTIIARPLHSVADHQRVWDIYFQPPAYDYNA